jgi:hypothetical protein
MFAWLRDESWCANHKFWLLFHRLLLVLPLLSRIRWFYALLFAVRARLYCVGGWVRELLSMCAGNVLRKSKNTVYHLHLTGKILGPGQLNVHKLPTRNLLKLYPWGTMCAMSHRHLHVCRRKRFCYRLHDLCAWLLWLRHKWRDTCSLWLQRVPSWVLFRGRSNNVHSLSDGHLHRIYLEHIRVSVHDLCT